MRADEVLAVPAPPEAPVQAPPGVPLEDPGFVEFVAAGTAAAGEYRCADCGYGAVVHRVVPLCPMCGGTVWESRGSRRPRFAD